MVVGLESMLFRYFPILNIFILNVATHGSYPFSAFLVLLYLGWVAVFEIAEVLKKTKYSQLSCYSELVSKGIIVIMFINYFSVNHAVV